MADQDAVKAFNEKVAELLKSAQPADIVGILKDTDSVIRSHINNQNNNQKSGEDK